MADFVARHPDSAFCMSSRPASALLSDAAVLYGSFLALDPAVVSFAYDVLFDAATLRSDPTPRGLDALDGASRAFGLHRLRGKPLAQLSEEAFLALEEARQAGLLEYRIDLRAGEAALRTQLEQLTVAAGADPSEFQEGSQEGQEGQEGSQEGSQGFQGGQEGQERGQERSQGFQGTQEAFRSFQRSAVRECCAQLAAQARQWVRQVPMEGAFHLGAARNGGVRGGAARGGGAGAAGVSARARDARCRGKNRGLA